MFGQHLFFILKVAWVFMFCGKPIAHIVFAHIQQIERIEKTIVEMFASCYPTPINVKKKTTMVIGQSYLF